jgi:general secretion pathway protein B
MSYILEALKKSDLQRQQGATPTLTSVQIPAEETRPRTLSWIVLPGTILFVAGILIGWLQPWKTEPARPPVAEKSAAQAPAVQASPSPTPASVPAAPPEALPARTAPLQATPAAAIVATPPNPGAPARPALAALATSAAPGPAPQESVAAASKPPPAADPVPATSKAPAVAEQKPIPKAELPPAIRQELPNLSVSIHAYSGKPAKRVVSVNDQLLYEGDTLAPGLILEQITPDGMIFSYKGFRFSQGLR